MYLVRQRYRLDGRKCPLAPLRVLVDWCSSRPRLPKASASSTAGTKKGSPRGSAARVGLLYAGVVAHWAAASTKTARDRARERMDRQSHVLRYEKDRAGP